MSNILVPDKHYKFGDFLMRPNKDGSIKIYCDKGVLAIIPRANNLVTIKSIKSTNDEILD